MGVKLKQRTWKTADGRAVAEGDPDAAILVGNEGAMVTDEQAEAMGLVNGAVSSKSQVPDEDKAYHGESEDKGARRKKRASKRG